MNKQNLYNPVRWNREALSDQVARQIIDLITDKSLKVGDRLPTLKELSEHLEVSRTAMREAIKLLEAWGVIITKHGVGTFVADPTDGALKIPLMISAERSESAILNLLQVREVLEPGIAALAAQNAKDDHIKELEELLQIMDQSINKPDKFNRADLDFHRTLAKATGNNLFLLVISPVIGILQDLIHMAQQVPGSGEKAQAYHRTILTHVKSGRADKAKEAMSSHLDQVRIEIQSRNENA